MVFLGLVTAVLVTVEVPLAASYAAARTQELFLDRSGDAARLARLAAPALARDAVDTLGPELRAYGELYGVVAEVRGPDGELLLGSAPGAAPAPAADALTHALVGRRSAPPETVLPWRAGPVTVAEPVLRGAEVAGAVVTTSPAGALVEDVVAYWAGLVVVGLGVLLVVGLATAPVTGWILRPVHRLDDAVHVLTAGDLTARAEVGDGPPELRRLVADFNSMAEALRASDDQMRALVADASHQLRNPLTALQLRIDALAARLLPEGREDHRLAVEEVERLTRVLDDTLALSRAQEDPGATVAVDVRECARDRLRMWSDAAAAVGTTMELVGDRPCWVLAPAGALEQVLDAVLDNALRLAPGGTVTVAVEPVDATSVELRVTDDGPGLTAEQCVAAVRRFWRGPDQQNVPGSGLGLAIASTLVQRCGGRLAVVPARPSGLQVVVRLPRPAGVRGQSVVTPAFAER